MNIKTISAEYKRKFNLGDFESVEFGCVIWADVQDYDDPDDCLKKLGDKAKESIRTQALEILQMRKKNPVPEFGEMQKDLIQLRFENEELIDTLDKLQKAVATLKQLARERQSDLVMSELDKLQEELATPPTVAEILEHL